MSEAVVGLRGVCETWMSQRWTSRRMKGKTSFTVDSGCRFEARDGCWFAFGFWLHRRLPIVFFRRRLRFGRPVGCWLSLAEEQQRTGVQLNAEIRRIEEANRHCESTHHAPKSRICGPPSSPQTKALPLAFFVNRASEVCGKRRFRPNKSALEWIDSKPHGRFQVIGGGGGAARFWSRAACVGKHQTSPVSFGRRAGARIVR